MRPIVIFGTGGFGREVHGLIEDIDADRPTYQVLGFLDGDPDSHGTTVHDLPVLGDAGWLRANAGVAVALGVGAPATKRRLAEALREAGATFETLVHPAARVGRRVGLGEGTVVCAGSTLTTEVEVGPLVTVNLDCTVGHDAVLSAFVTLAPGVHVSGNVAVGEGTDLGTGAVVIQGVTLGGWSIVGAGAVVVRDLPANVTAVGAPARVVKEREAGWHR